MALRTTNSRTSAALGTEADETEAAVDVRITVMISPKPRKIPFICAMNMLATATKSAVPSILILQPIGKTNLVTLGSTLSFSVIRRKVTGSAAALYKAALAKIGQSTLLDDRMIRSTSPVAAVLVVILA